MELEADNAGITEMLEKSESSMSRILSVTMFAFVIVIHYWRFFSFSFLPEKVSNSSQFRKWWWEIQIGIRSGYSRYTHWRIPGMGAFNPTGLSLLQRYMAVTFSWVKKRVVCWTKQPLYYFLALLRVLLDLLYLQSFNDVEVQSRMRALLNFSKSSVWRYDWQHVAGPGDGL